MVLLQFVRGDSATLCSPNRGPPSFAGGFVFAKYDGLEQDCKHLLYLCQEGRPASRKRTQRFWVLTYWLTDVDGSCDMTGPCPETLWDANRDPSGEGKLCGLPWSLVNLQRCTRMFVQVKTRRNTTQRNICLDDYCSFARSLHNFAKTKGFMLAARVFDPGSHGLHWDADYASGCGGDSKESDVNKNDIAKICLDVAQRNYHCGGEITCVCGDSDIHCFGGVWKPEDFDWTDVIWCRLPTHEINSISWRSEALCTSDHPERLRIRDLASDFESNPETILGIWNHSEARTRIRAWFNQGSSQLHKEFCIYSGGEWGKTWKIHEHADFLASPQHFVNDSWPLESPLFCCRQVEKRKVSHQSCQAEDKPNTPWIWSSSSGYTINLLHQESFFTPP